MATIIVDDRDSSITTTGTWNQEGNNQEYQNTTTYSTHANSTLTFPFYGSGIEVFATIREWNGATQMSFSIDGTTLHNFTSPASGNDVLYHQPIFSLPTTSTFGSALSLDAPHTLVMTVLSAQTNPSILVDYILVSAPYTTNGSELSATGAYAPYEDKTLYIDDASGLIAYSGSWNASAGTLQSFSLTAHAASGAASTNGNWTDQPTTADAPAAALTLPGTGFTVYASLPTGTTGALARFVLAQFGEGDEGPATDTLSTYTLTQEMVGEIGMNETMGLALNVPVYGVAAGGLGRISVSGDLAEWQLTIYPLDDAFALDYVAVYAFSGVLSANATAVSPASPISPSSPSPSPSPSSDTSPSSHSHAGAIAGGVVGGLLALALLLALVLFLRRQGRTAGRRRSATLNPVVRARALAVARRGSLQGQGYSEGKEESGEVEAGIDMKNMEDARELDI